MDFFPSWINNPFKDIQSFFAVTDNTGHRIFWICFDRKNAELICDDLNNKHNASKEKPFYCVAQIAFSTFESYKKKQID